MLHYPPKKKGQEKRGVSLSSGSEAWAEGQLLCLLLARAVGVLCASSPESSACFLLPSDTLSQVFHSSTLPGALIVRSLSPSACLVPCHVSQDPQQSSGHSAFSPSAPGECIFGCPQRHTCYPSYEVLPQLYADVSICRPGFPTLAQGRLGF